GSWYIRTVSGTILAWNQPWGWAGAIPVPGDYDGDGRSDLAVFDDSSGAWYMQTVSGSLIAWNQPWGWAGAVPVPGDYNGDGISDLAVWDPATGIWYIRTVSGTILAWNQPWGWHGAWPVGDGRPGWGNTIYLSPSGSDANTGDSPQTALRSIQTALGRANPGDIVAMLPGDYFEEVRLEGIGGSAGSPVYLRAVGGSARLTGNSALSGGLLMEGCRYISIEGIEVADFVDFGIQLVACDAITVRSCDLHHNGLLTTQASEGGYGLYVNGSGHAILNNTVRTNGANPDVGDGIIGWGTTNTVVRGNTCNYNMGNGILVEDSVGVLVEWNTVSYNEGLSTDGTWWNAGLWLDGGHHVTVRNNAFTHNLGPGIEISDEEGQAPYAYEVSGNDISFNDWGVYLWGFRYRAAEPIVIRNNTVTNNSRAPLWIDLAVTPEELNILIE
ncbi:MAG: right-handed parallel beta-helix repeat-containing protein, partial [Lentisphaerae bacterium]|nr:right-handed parallel beta-helix repeat-containing protein [Lentisphaerota bacterium]